MPDAVEVAGALRTSIGLVVRRLRQRRDEGELSLPERSALARLERGGPATAAEVARAEQISPQSMGATLAALEAQGLVERSHDPQDGRRVVLAVSPAGLQALHERRSAQIEFLAAALEATFSTPELRQLQAAAALLERLADRL